MKKSFVWMFVFWVVFLAIEIFDIFLASRFDEGTFSLVTLLISTVFLFVWFLSDSKDENIITSKGLKIAVIAVSFIAIPYYLIKYKGIKRFGFSFLKFFGFAVVFLMVVTGIEYLNV